MSTLKDEIAAYETMRADLEASHLGEWALVHERKLVQVFSDFQQAAKEAVSRFGRGPYLIRQIGSAPKILPASILIGPNNESRKLRL